MDIEQLCFFSSKNNTPTNSSFQIADFTKNNEKQPS